MLNGWVLAAGGLALSTAVTGWVLLIMGAGMEETVLPQWPRIEPGDHPRHVRLVYSELGPVDWNTDPDFEYLVDPPDAA